MAPQTCMCNAVVDMMKPPFQSLYEMAKSFILIYLYIYESNGQEKNLQAFHETRLSSRIV